MYQNGKMLQAIKSFDEDIKVALVHFAESLYPFNLRSKTVLGLKDFSSL